MSAESDAKKQRVAQAALAHLLANGLEQGAIITAHGAGNTSARIYVEFLGSPQARRILGDFGYRIPAPKF